MKHSSLFGSMALGAVLAMGAAAYAASPSVPRRAEGPPAMATTDPANSLTLHFQGAERIWIDGTGKLEIVHPDGGILRYRPALFQMVNGKRKSVQYSVHVVDRDHVELIPLHSDSSAPLELAPLHPVGRNS